MVWVVTDENGYKKFFFKIEDVLDWEKKHRETEEVPQEEFWYNKI